MDETKTERFEMRMKPSRKAMLNDLAADDGITAAEWLDVAISTAWNQRQIENAAAVKQSAQH